MIDPETALTQFATRYSGRPDLLVHSPGRVNLIGEHVDYNSGLVLPMAIDRGIALAARLRDDRKVRVWSQSLADADGFSLDDVERASRSDWCDYVRGVAAVLTGRGVRLAGADLCVLSDLPVGGGLSSSASLEVGSALALLELAGATVAPAELARLCQQAEHRYANVPCGLMDQFAVVFGRAGHALRMDCRSLECQQVPCDHEAIAWVVLDSRAPRKLAGSGYVQRRKECDRALAALRRAGLPLESLRDVTMEMIEEQEDRLGATLTRRVRHVVTEIARVVEGGDYLAMERYDLFGRLMFASHHSLAEDYEASLTELDHIVAEADDTLGVYGCRMTGGGWGGCVIALLAAEATRFFQERVSHSFARRFGRPPGYLVVRPSDGARVERL